MLPPGRGGGEAGWTVDLSVPAEFLTNARESIIRLGCRCSKRSSPPGPERLSRRLGNRGAGGPDGSWASSPQCCPRTQAKACL